MRTACGLHYFDGPPVALPLAQARTALAALAADADRQRYLLLRALRTTPPPTAGATGAAGVSPGTD